MANLFDDYFLDHVKVNPENHFEYTVTKPLKVFKMVRSRRGKAVASLLIPVGAKINVPAGNRAKLEARTLGVYNEATGPLPVRMLGWAKLRTDKADVVAVANAKTGAAYKSGRAAWASDFVYQVGTGVRPTLPLQCNGSECQPGIHFFLTVDEARHYG